MRPCAHAMLCTLLAAQLGDYAQVFNVVPTFLEVSLVAGILAYKCGPAFAALTAGTITLYSLVTFAVTSVSHLLAYYLSACSNSVCTVCTNLKNCDAQVRHHKAVGDTRVCMQS